MIQIETITGTAFSAIISSMKGGYSTAFGFFSSGEFQCARPSRTFKSLAGAQKAAREWAAK